MSGPPIVSSAHLVSEQSTQLSEFEFGLNMAINAYHRWIVHCMAAAGQDGLGALDVLVLHLVNHREREKRLSDLCFLLNIEDSHVVNYSLKKLARMELVTAHRRGKETFHATNEAGQAADLWIAIGHRLELGAQVKIFPLNPDHDVSPRSPVGRTRKLKSGGSQRRPKLSTFGPKTNPPRRLHRLPRSRRKNTKRRMRSISVCRWKPPTASA